MGGRGTLELLVGENEPRKDLVEGEVEHGDAGHAPEEPGGNGGASDHFVDDVELAQVWEQEGEGDGDDVLGGGGGAEEVFEDIITGQFLTLADDEQGESGHDSEQGGRGESGDEQREGGEHDGLEEDAEHGRLKVPVQAVAIVQVVDLGGSFGGEFPSILPESDFLRGQAGLFQVEHGAAGEIHDQQRESEEKDDASQFSEQVFKSWNRFAENGIKRAVIHIPGQQHGRAGNREDSGEPRHGSEGNGFQKPELLFPSETRQVTAGWRRWHDIPKHNQY